jgi:hypothetical protein
MFSNIAFGHVVIIVVMVLAMITAIAYLGGASRRRR